jgi:peptidoglycan hydrolase-like protein with peptidoglycan-binding domain
MWPIVKRGNTGEDVRTVQYLLLERGQQVDVDGEFGAMTEERVRAFQSGAGLSADGEVGPQTWPALVVQVAQGSTGNAVKAVQGQLLYLRPGHGVVDGIFGSDTDDAVRRFQLKEGLAVDGIVGPHTWETLVGEQRGHLDVEGTAFALFDAWMQHDRNLARLVATEDAVTTLFAMPWRADDGWQFRRDDGTAGHMYLVWGRPGQEVAFGVPTQVQGEPEVDQVIFNTPGGDV